MVDSFILCKIVANWLILTYGLFHGKDLSCLCYCSIFLWFILWALIFMVVGNAKVSLLLGEKWPLGLVGLLWFSFFFSLFFFSWKDSSHEDLRDSQPKKGGPRMRGGYVKILLFGKMWLTFIYLGMESSSPVLELHNISRTRV